MKTRHNHAMFSTLAVATLELDHGVVERRAAKIAHRLTMPVDDEELGAITPRPGAVVEPVLQSIRAIGEGAFSASPPAFDQAFAAAQQRFDAWHTRGARCDGDAHLLAWRRWWVSGPTSGVAGVRRFGALRDFVRRVIDEKTKDERAHVQSAAHISRDFEREREVVTMTSQALAAETPGQRLMPVSWIPPTVVTAALLAAMLASGASWSALVVGAASVWPLAAAGVWLGGKLRTGDPLEQNPHFVIAAKAARLFERYWEARISASVADAERRSLADAFDRFCQEDTVAPAARTARMLAELPLAAAPHREVTFIEAAPNRVIVDLPDSANDAHAVACAQDFKALDDVIAAIGVETELTTEEFIDRLCAALPRRSISETLLAALTTPAARERLAGHLDALLGVASGLAGRLQTEVIVDADLSPRTITIALPNGPMDPLVSTVLRRIPNATIVRSTSATRIEVIVDTQNLRFDDLQFADEARVAQSELAAREQGLWNFIREV